MHIRIIQTAQRWDKGVCTVPITVSALELYLLTFGSSYRQAGTSRQNTSILHPTPTLYSGEIPPPASHCDVVDRCIGPVPPHHLHTPGNLVGVTRTSLRLHHQYVEVHGRFGEGVQQHHPLQRARDARLALLRLHVLAQTAPHQTNRVTS